MHRSARTGRAVSAKEAKANPETTVKEGKSKDAVRLDWVLKHLDCLPAKTVTRRTIDAAMKAENR